MIVECEKCRARVDAVNLASYPYDPPGEAPANIYFLRCPQCMSPILAMGPWDPEPDDVPIRMFPPTESRLDRSLPSPIRSSFDEALSCYQAKAYTAAAIMCRKTLQGICVEHEVLSNNLAQALREMKDKGLIESRLFEWADELRLSGNQAAHDVKSSMSPADARDILDFTRALLEYVFTFRDKFDQFRQRRRPNSAT